MNQNEVEYRSKIGDVRLWWERLGALAEDYRDEAASRQLVQDQGAVPQSPDQVFEKRHQQRHADIQAKYDKAWAAANEEYQDCIQRGVEVPSPRRDGEIDVTSPTNGTNSPRSAWMGAITNWAKSVEPSVSDTSTQDIRNRADDARRMIHDFGKQPQNYSLDPASNPSAYSTAARTGSSLTPRTSIDAESSALSSQMASLSLFLPPSARRDQSHPTKSPTTLIRSSTDDRTGSTTIEHSGPTEVITDSSLQNMGIGASKLFRGSGGDVETFDSGFRKRDKKFFTFGKVFMSLWTEPLGGNTSTIIRSEVTQVRFGERVFSKVRKFVVIREGDQSCTALPIFTCSSRGVAESSHKVSEHGLVYTGKVRPASLPGEETMQEVPIRVDPDVAGDKLDPISRIHYGKVYTIEHNVKVKQFGMVNRYYQDLLIAQFKAVWVNNLGLRAQRRPVDRDSASVRERSMGTRIPAIPESSQQSRPEPVRQPQGLTERQREALQEHGRAAEQRGPRRHGLVRSGPDRTIGGQSNENNDADSSPFANASTLSAADEQRVRDVYVRCRQEFINRGVDREEASTHAQAAAAEKMRQLLSEMASKSRPFDGPRSSSGSLVVGSPPRQGYQPPTPAIPIPSSQTRSSSIGANQQVGAEPPPSSLPKSSGQAQYSGSFVPGSSPRVSQPQQLTQRITSANARPAQQSSDRTPTMSKATVAQPSASASVTVETLTRLGFSVDSANQIRILVDRGLSLATSITVSNLVDQGYTMTEAIATVTQHMRGGRKK